MAEKEQLLDFSLIDTKFADAFSYLSDKLTSVFKESKREILNIQAEFPGDLPILVVDDDECIVNIYNNILKSITSTYYILQDGCEVESFLKKYNVDFIILDLIMPVMGGIEVLKRLRENNQRKYVIVISATLFDESSFYSQVIKELYLLSQFHQMIWLPKDFNAKYKIRKAIQSLYNIYLKDQENKHEN